jgi:two-component system, chemotaxis family, chemotaxis protein CheY
MAFLKHLKVLIVDDTSVSRMLLVDGLTQIGITNVTMAQDGEQGLKQMMTNPAHLILSDFTMPKLDGLQFLRAIREYAPTRQAGFILVTGRGDKELILKGRALGLNNYLPKPFTVPVLRATIEAVVGKLV